MKSNRRFFNRYTALFVIMILIFSAILSKLVYLQIVKAAEYTDMANKASVTEVPDLAPRGKIEDSSGTVLATNKQSYNVTFTETPDSKAAFFQTMSSVFSILDSNGETQQDDFELKIDPNNNFYFQFPSSDAKVRQQLELRFKKDRGMDSSIINKLFPKQKEKLSEAQQGQVDQQLLNISPKDTYDYLLKFYGIDDPAHPKYSLQVERRLMIVKDTIRMQSFSGYKPTVIASNIKQQTAFIFYQKLSGLPGIDVTMQPLRYYPYGKLGSSFLGYISKIQPWDQEKYSEQGYDPSTDYVGASGIENVYENYLKGTKGGQIVRLNNQGRIIDQLGSTDAVPGDTIQLTINKDVEYSAETSLQQVMSQLQKAGQQADVNTSNATRGAAVAIDVHTGAILALASAPEFNPNDFADPRGLTTAEYQAYFNPDLEAFGKARGFTQEQIDQIFPMDSKTNSRYDKYDEVPKPLYDYATMSVTPPGSTFKPITAVAGLETGVITPGTIVNDQGYFDDGNGFHTTFPSDGANGPVDLAKALEKSSNPFFMTVGERLRAAKGDDVLAQYAWQFGMGADPNSKATPSTGIEIPERFGQVFNDWSIKHLYGQLYLGTTEEMLKSGKGNLGGGFTAINLITNNGDSSELKNLKQQIKNSIQDSIENGNFSDSTYTNLLNQLISTDPVYNGKKISKGEMQNILANIYYVTISEANFQTKIGANMYNAAIGQGISQFTPLQLADYIATLVNGGTRYSAHLVDKIIDPNGEVIQQTQPQVLDKVNMSQSTVNAIMAGMHEVNSVNGTAAGVFDGFPIDTAGKTGSATFSNTQDQIGRTSFGVYVGFAPFDNPQIAVAVVVFDGGHGGFVAPVARAMYEAYFKNEIAKIDPGYKPEFQVTAQPEP